MPWFHFFQIFFILRWNLISFHCVLYSLGRWYNNILRNIQVLMQLEKECFFKWKPNSFHDRKYKSVHVRETHLFSLFSNMFTFLTCVSWTNVIFLQVIAISKYFWFYLDHFWCRALWRPQSGLEMCCSIFSFPIKI